MPILGEVRAPRVLTALTIGRDAVASLRDTVGTRAIVASFADATYVSVGERMIVVTSRRVCPGPMYVAVDTDDVSVDLGVPVGGDPGRLELGHLHIALDSAAIWSGRLPGSEALVAARDVVIDALAPVAGRSGITAAPYTKHLDAAWAALAQRDFDEVARSIIGLGPGLTPAGDDVLSGLLVVAVGAGVISPGEWTPGAEIAARTSALSFSFVRLAATGQAIAPVHDVLMAGAKSHRRACAAAADNLLRVGGTSGADIAFGMWAGMLNLTS